MAGVNRRQAVLGTAGGALAVACGTSKKSTEGVMDIVESFEPLRFPWQTRDPFLFCAYHDDAYPAGNPAQGPNASLTGRQMGSDFAGTDGWRMYHGEVVPGFPRHPHRGFETVTVVRRGLVDHSDSLGATARYGRGDVQWLTTGAGIQHAEMFPLVDGNAPNPLELFQIWLNLPAKKKMVAPYFTMFWADQIPAHAAAGARVTTIAGALPGNPAPPAPPPDSWASDPTADVAIWTIALDPKGRVTIPAARSGTHRDFYFFAGSGVELNGRALPSQHRVLVRADRDATLVAGNASAEILMLQGKPLGEPVVQHGPFVMNRREEIAQAIDDYRATQFGGWPWSADDPVHKRVDGRFAKHPDGRRDVPT